MTDRMEARLLHCLAASSDAEAILHAFVRELDLSFADPHAPLALAKAFVSIAPMLITKHGYGADHPTAATLHAAEAFIAEPSDGTWEFCVRVATMSYPFGPGDGCYSVTAHQSCERGSGCASGAGTLIVIAGDIGVELAYDAICAALVPWLIQAR